MDTAYRYYRLWITRGIQPGLSYLQIGTLSLFESSSASGLDLAQGKVTTAISNYASSQPSYATDGNPATMWESNSLSNNPGWIMVDLGADHVVRSFIVGGGKITYRPREFEIQGSHDGIEFESIQVIDDFWLAGELGTSRQVFWGLVILALPSKQTGGRRLAYCYATGIPESFLPSSFLMPKEHGRGDHGAHTSRS